MSVAVVVPWRPGCVHRERAWAWVRARYAEHHPDWLVIEGAPGDGPFSRSRAILDAAGRTDAAVLVVADGDVWCDPLPAVEEVQATGWAVPHRMIHRLSQESTERMLAGEPWPGLPLSHDNPQDRRPYVGRETGTLVVLTREAFEAAPPDRRFVGWGQEDTAWSIALRRIVGPPWRGRDDLVHLWHPPQPRLNRRVGSSDSMALLARYRRARTPEQTKALIAEATRER